MPGAGEVDYLSGGSGKDIFVLGDKTRAYYNDGNAAVNGTTDFAYIEDYNVAQKDVIRLKGSRANYDIVEGTYSVGSNGGGYYGTGIYLKGSTSNELVAIVGSYNSNTAAQVSAGLTFV